MKPILMYNDGVNNDGRRTFSGIEFDSLSELQVFQNNVKFRNAMILANGVLYDSRDIDQAIADCTDSVQLASSELCADLKYAEDLAEVLEHLLSQVSLLKDKSDYIRSAATNANNVLDEYQQAKDAEDAAIKAELA